MYKVAGKPGYVKTEGGGVKRLLTDDYKKYLELKAERTRELEKQHRMETDINNLKNELGEIKGMLKALLEK